METDSLGSIPSPSFWCLGLGMQPSPLYPSKRSAPFPTPRHPPPSRLCPPTVPTTICYDSLPSRLPMCWVLTVMTPYCPDPLIPCLLGALVSYCFAFPLSSCLLSFEYHCFDYPLIRLPVLWVLNGVASCGTLYSF